MRERADLLDPAAKMEAAFKLEDDGIKEIPGLAIVLVDEFDAERMDRESCVIGDSGSGRTRGDQAMRHVEVKIVVLIPVRVVSAGRERVAFDSDISDRMYEREVQIQGERWHLDVGLVEDRTRARRELDAQPRMPVLL